MICCGLHGCVRSHPDKCGLDGGVGTSQLLVFIYLLTIGSLFCQPYDGKRLIVVSWSKPFVRPSFQKSGGH